jgi:hypothetical protein
MYLPERFINRLAEDNRGKRADSGTAFSNWLQPAPATGQASKQR